MSDKEKRNTSHDAPFSENPKSGDAGPEFYTELNSEKPKAGEATETAVAKSEKPKW